MIRPSSTQGLAIPLIFPSNEFYRIWTRMLALIHTNAPITLGVVVDSLLTNDLLLKVRAEGGVRTITTTAGALALLVLLLLISITMVTHEVEILHSSLRLPERFSFTVANPTMGLMVQVAVQIRPPSLLQLLAGTLVGNKTLWPSDSGMYRSHSSICHFKINCTRYIG